MAKKLFRANLAVFLIFWLGITGYTLWSLFNLSLPYSAGMFGVFLAVLLMLGLPLVWQWYKKEKITAAVMLIFCGVLLLVPVHSMVSLHVDALQLRWIAFAYIGEMALVGAMVVYAVLYTARFAYWFMKGGVSRDMPPGEIHARIAAIPARAGIAFAGTVLLGYAVISLQLYYASLLPLAEVIKNLINGILAGAISLFAAYFTLEHMLYPVRQKSGAQLKPGKAAHRRGLSLFTKIYAAFSLLVLISVGFFATMAYSRAQAVLENQMLTDIKKDLGAIVMDWEAGQRSLSNEERAVYYIIPETVPRLISAYEFSETARKTLEQFSGSDSDTILFIDRARDVKAVGLVKADTGYLAVVSLARDYDRSLQQLLMYFVYIITIVSLIAAILGVFLSHSIILPIREMQEGKEVYTNDELEDLSNALKRSKLV